MQAWFGSHQGGPDGGLARSLHAWLQPVARISCAYCCRAPVAEPYKNGNDDIGLQNPVHQTLAAPWHQ